MNLTSFLTNFHFSEPLFLWLLLPLLVLCFFYKKISFLRKIAAIDKDKYLSFIAEENLQLLTREEGASVKKEKKVNIFILFLCLFFLILALAGPRYTFSEQKVKTPHRNIVFLLDSSLSMSVEDIVPNRFAVAKEEVNSLLNVFDTTRVAVISFTEIPHIINSFTKDYKEVSKRVKGLDLKSFKRQGSNISKALDLSFRLFDNIGAEQKENNFIIIFSDGEFERKLTTKQYKQLQKYNIIIYAVGTEIGGPIIKNGEIIEHQGQKVISKLDYDNLQKLAQNIGAKLALLNNVSSSNFALQFLQKEQNDGDKGFLLLKIWQMSFWIFLLPSLLCLLYLFRKGLFVFLFVVALMPEPSYADIFLNDDAKGKKSFAEKNFSEAINHFSSGYNKGVASYKDKKYDDAIKYFNESDNEYKDYNLGNSYFMKGDYQESIKSYDRFLESHKSNKEAKYNKKKAEELLKKQQENKDKQKKTR